MAVLSALKSGNTAQLDAYVGYLTEIVYDTDKNTIRVHDGTKVGGYELVGNVTRDGNNIIYGDNVSFSAGNTTITIDDNGVRINSNTLIVGTTNVLAAIANAENVVIKVANNLVGNAAVLNFQNGNNIIITTTSNGNQINLLFSSTATGNGGGNGASALLNYTYSSNTDNVTPGVGIVKFDSEDLTTATEMYLDYFDDYTNDLSDYFTNLNNDGTGYIKIISGTNPEKFAI
jgi:hypothetical protein